MRTLLWHYLVRVISQEILTTIPWFLGENRDESEVHDSRTNAALH